MGGYEGDATMAYSEAKAAAPEAPLPSVLAGLERQVISLDKMLDQFMDRLTPVLEMGEDGPVPSEQRLAEIRRGSSSTFCNIAQAIDRLEAMESRVRRVYHRLEV